MKECLKVKKLLSRYLDKETNDVEITLVKTHLEICSLCKKELLELSRVKELISGKERKVLPEDYLVGSLRERITNEQQAERKISLAGIGNLSRWLIPVPVATIVLLITFLFLISTRQRLSEYSLEDNLLSGTPVTMEDALGLILGVTD